MPLKRERFRRHNGRVWGVDFANYETGGGNTLTAAAHVLLGGAPDAMSTATGAGPHGRVLQSAHVFNNNAATEARCFFGGRFPTSEWGAGEWVDGAAGNDFTDKTTEAQSVGGVDFDLQGTGGGGANDGFVIHASRPFSAVVIDASDAYGAAGAVVAHEWTYWNGAWTDLESYFMLPVSDLGVAAEQYPIVFAPPADWALTAAAGPAEGVPVDQYAIRYRATTAPGADAANASQIHVGHALRHVVQGVTTGGGAEGSHRINLPLCSRDETPWVVLGQSMDKVHVAVTMEKTAYAGIIGEL